MNQAFSDQGLRQALRGGNLPAANAGAQDSPSQRARRHWRLVQSLYVEYVRAHRCTSAFSPVLETQEELLCAKWHLQCDEWKLTCIVLSLCTATCSCGIFPGTTSGVGEVSSDADSTSVVYMCRRVVRGKWHKVIKLAVAEGVKRGALLR